MRVLTASVLFLFFALSVSAQTQGVIECRDESSIPIWEKPGSIVEIKRLHCGDSVLVLGSENDYIKIRLGESRVGFVKAVNVQFVKEPLLSSVQSVRETKQREEAPQFDTTQTAIPPKDTQTSISHNSSRMRSFDLELGIEISSLKFKQFLIYEEISKQTLMDESGLIWGGYGSFTFHPQKYAVRLEGRFGLGTVDYFSPDITYPQNVTNISNLILEPRALLGREFLINESVTLMPFGGFGYRYRCDGMGGKQSSFGYYYYDRKSNYLYTPLGAEARFGLGGGWSLNISGEYDLFWQGMQYNELSDINPEASNIKYIQKDGWGTRGSVAITKRFGRMSFVFEPFFRYWNIKSSEMVEYNWIEPDNQTREWGTKLGWRF